MKRIITLALMALTLSGGVAAADRHDRRDHRDDRRSDRADRRHDRQDRRIDRRVDRLERRDHRWHNNHRGNVHVTRTRPTFRNNTFYFNGGYHRTYRAPVVRYRYRNYYQRPAILVENYDPVPGYIWVAGSWSWNGYEWTWVNGHYEVDANYQVDAYYDGY